MFADRDVRTIVREGNTNPKTTLCCARSHQIVGFQNSIGIHSHVHTPFAILIKGTAYGEFGSITTDGDRITTHSVPRRRASQDVNRLPARWIDC